MKTESELKFIAKNMHNSIEWWKSEMAHWVNESDIWMEREDDPYYEEAMEEISDAMNYLILKGEWENKGLAQLEEDITQFEIHKAFSSNSKNPSPVVAKPKKILKNIKQKQKKKDEKK